MSKKPIINKKRNWSKCRQPPEPTPPNEPAKEHKIQNFVSFTQLYESEVKLSDLVLPEGIAMDDVVVRGWGDFSIEFGTYETKVKPNPRYKSELVRYQKELASYEKAKEEHKKELDEWKAWVKKIEDERIQNEIKRAKCILKKYGCL
jgi:alpha-L-arabinofuranosidase